MSFKGQKIEEVIPIKVAPGLNVISSTGVGGTGRNVRCGEHSARDTETSADGQRLATRLDRADLVPGYQYTQTKQTWGCGEEEVGRQRE